jgi:DNA-binding NarL/FixJ family response regulator
VRILIADDYPFSLAGTKAFVESLNYTVEDICSNGIAALNLITAHQPHIAILDINMPGMDGLEVLAKVGQQKLPTKIILLTMHKERTIFNKAFSLGAYGYVLKENAQDELKLCLEAVIKGLRYTSKNLDDDLKIDSTEGSRVFLDKLTFAEKKILELVAQQKTSRQIAELLFISEKTVEGHRTNIIQKLELPKSKNSLLIWALKHFTG